MAAHLAGARAARTILPVIGVPLSSSPLKGADSLLSTVQMPKGVPVACVALDGAENAAHLALQILALGDPKLAEKLQEFKESMRLAAEESNESLQSRVIFEALREDSGDRRE
jgi:5-(carboxyamino)imidazole ribonucleotide mutase